MYVGDGHPKVGQDRQLQATKLACDLRSPAIKADVTFMSCLDRAFFNRHFLWHQAKDTFTKKYSFRSHRMTARVFLMRRDLDAALAGTLKGSDMPEFARWHKALEDLPENEQLDAAGAKAPSQHMSYELAQGFMADAVDLLRKHTARFISGKNVWFGLGDEPTLGRALARVITGEEVDEETEQHDSPAHECVRPPVPWRHGEGELCGILAMARRPRRCSLAHNWPYSQQSICLNSRCYGPHWVAAPPGLYGSTACGSA